MISRMYGYVRARQLEGSFSPDPSIGNWVVSAMRILRGWGTPDESEWPYDGDADHWPPNEPDGIDELAKNNRILAYQRVRSVNECKIILASETPLVLALEITEQWDTAPQGEIVMSAESITGSHAITLFGYDDSRQSFLFANSWGTEWGNEGYGVLPYEYFDAYQLEAWMITERFWIRPSQPPPAVSFLQWGIVDILGTILHCAEVFDGVSDECIGWAFIVEREGFAEVEELFVRPMYRGKGYASLLSSMINDISQSRNLPVRLWIPHADVSQLNKPSFNRVIEQLGLSLKPSGRRWAAMKAE